jgi:hypothetical protein
MIGRIVRSAFPVLALLSFLVANSVSAEEARPQLSALSLVAPSCSALILPEAKTREQFLLNQQAKRDFLKVRNSMAAATVCSIAVDPADPVPEGTAESGVVEKAVAVKACGDCPTCLSAATCSGCAVGSVCSPPGAIPTRACRAVGSCSDWFGNVTYCCGCS